MKKILLLVVCLIFLFFVPITYADGILSSTESRDLDATQTITVTADFSDTVLHASLAGGYLFQVAIKTTLDESVTFAIANELGCPLFSESWSAAATGEAPKSPSSYFWIPAGTSPTATLSGLGSGSATIQITVLKK
jgi:hypothetical protein